MDKINIAALTSFGVESIAADEIRELGYSDLTIENGRIRLSGDLTDVARLNINLRCSDRVVISFGSFMAEDFGELFEGVKALPWEEFIPPDAEIHVTGKSVKSQLHSVPDCQSLTKKAIVEALKRRHNIERFPETGPRFRVEISMLKDKAELTIDTSGDGLHRRGYRPLRVAAPLRETLAACIIRLSRWDPSRPLADPFCGSGTIPIEAAMLARKIPPGLNRTFASESWPQIPEQIWKEERDRAASEITDTPCDISASDIDYFAVSAAQSSAVTAGVDKNIVFQKKPVAEFSTKKKYGCIITNPPYGERLGDRKGAEALYRELSEKLPRLDTWSLFILSSHQDFASVFRKKPDKNRKLYNGKIKCFLNMYLGPLPPKK